MKVLKFLVIAIVCYVALVVAFESLIGVFQPTADATLVITTFDAEGAAHDRVVSRLDSDGRLYVAANHWPRAWFDRARSKPEVRVTQDGATGDYSAVPIDAEEYARVDRDNGLPFVFRIVTGFPPRKIVRLDPR